MRRAIGVLLMACLFMGVSQCWAAAYTIEVLVPETGVTGTSAVAYQQWRTAAEMAAADVTALWQSGPDTLTVVVSDNTNSATLNTRLATDTTAIAVIGAGSDDLTVQAALALNYRGIPLLSPNLRTPFDSSLDNLFTLITPYEASEEVAADLMNHYGWDSLGLLYGRDTESALIRQAFKNSAFTILAELELTDVPPLTFAAKSALFSELQTNMARFTIASNNIYVVTWKNFDAAIAFLYAAEVATGLNGLTKGWIWLDVPTEWLQVIPNGAFILQAVPANATGIASFLEDLRTFASEPTLALQKDSMFVYDSIMMAAQAIVDSGGATAAAVRDHLKTMTYEGVTGQISFRTSGHRSTQLYEILNQVPRTNYTSPNVFVPALTPALLGSTRYTQLAYNHDHNGLSDELVTSVWPGRTTTPTSGNWTTWPIAFFSRLPGTTTFGVPMTRPEMIIYGRWIMDYLNDRSGFLPSWTRLSMPPLDDTGTSAGAVRSAALFPSFGFVGIVGSDTSEISESIQNIISAYNMPQISHGGTGSYLSDKTDYPSFFRTVGSESAQMRGLAQLAVDLGWDNIAIISTDGSYGTDLSSSLLAGAERVDLRISGSRQLTASSDIAAEIKSFSEEDHYHIVAALGEPRDILSIRQHAKAVGFNPRAWLVPAKFFQYNISLVLSNYDGLTLEDFNGFVGLAPGLRTDTPGYQAWWSAMTDPVTGIAANVRAVCAEQTLYCAYVYDSIMSLANGIKNAVVAGDAPSNFTALLEHIRSVNVELATGTVSFDANQDRRNSPFSVLNRQSNAVQQVGSWMDDGSMSQLTSAIVWPDGTTNVPASSDPPKLMYLEWSSAPAIVFAILAGIGIIVTIILFVVVLQQLDSPIIRTATWQFLLVILFGCALGYGSMYTWIGEPKDWICGLRIWLPPLAYVIVLAPLLAKTWRLHKIFTLGSLKVVPIPFWKLCVLVGSIIAVQVVICIVWISIGTVKPALVANKNAFGEFYVVCGQNRSTRIMTYITYGYCGMVTLAGAYLAFIVRKLPKDFNESRWLGFSMYNSLLFGAIILILGYSLVGFPRTVLILICAITLALVTGVIVFMYFPKMWDLFRHPEKRSGSGSKKTTGSTSIEGENTRTFRRHDYSRNASHTDSAEMEERKPEGRRHDYSLKSKTSHDSFNTNNSSAGSKNSKKK